MKMCVCVFVYMSPHRIHEAYSSAASGDSSSVEGGQHRVGCLHWLR